MPPQVRRAIWLLWFMLAVAAISMVVAWESFAAELSAAEFKMYISTTAAAATMAVIVALQALLIVFISRRHNWARIVLLILILVGCAAALWPEWYPDSMSWDWWVSNVAFTGLEFLALYWLFTGPARAWFTKAA